MRIPKRFKGHAAYSIRALSKYYKPKPLSRLAILSACYDRTDDGPEVNAINFFKAHPNGKPHAKKTPGTPMSRCLHTESL